jgi:hypothetical protein
MRWNVESQTGTFVVICDKQNIMRVSTFQSVTEYSGILGCYVM